MVSQHIKRAHGRSRLFFPEIVLPLISGFLFTGDVSQGRGQQLLQRGRRPQPARLTACPAAAQHVAIHLVLACAGQSCPVCHCQSLQTIILRLPSPSTEPRPAAPAPPAATGSSQRVRISRLFMPRYPLIGRYVILYCRSLRRRNSFSSFLTSKFGKKRQDASPDMARSMDLESFRQPLLLQPKAHLQPPRPATTRSKKPDTPTGQVRKGHRPRSYSE